MRIYLAGPFNKQAYLSEVRTQLELSIPDTEVTSRWLDFEPGLNEAATDHFRSVCATVDLADVERADVLIQYTNNAKGTGGRHVELGYALALGKRVIVIGKHENIFHWHTDVTVVPTLQAALDILVSLANPPSLVEAW